MRAVLTLLLLAAVVVVALILTDVINVRQTREGAMPAVEVREGEMPEFQVDTADIDIGTRERTVEVPDVRMRSAGEVAEERESEEADGAPAETSTP